MKCAGSEAYFLFNLFKIICRQLFNDALLSILSALFMPFFEKIAALICGTGFQTKSSSTAPHVQKSEPPVLKPIVGRPRALRLNASLAPEKLHSTQKTVEKVIAGLADVPKECSESLRKLTDAAYPPLPRAFPALGTDQVLQLYGAQIHQTADELPLTPEEFNRYVLPVIRRAIGYLHLLPASKDYHHKGMGGLLAHSLEVGLLAARGAGVHVFDRAEDPRARYHNRSRWIYAAWLAGFLHDAGKPLTDMTVTSSGELWYPYSAPLIDWLYLNNAEHYYVGWRSERTHNEHQTAVLSILPEIVGKGIIQWLYAHGSERIWRSFELAVSGLTGPENLTLIGTIVIEADKRSTEQDRKARPDLDERKLVVESSPAKRILETIRHLVLDGSWRVNEPGARLWVTNQGVFLVWNETTSEEIWRCAVTSLKSRELPRRPAGLVALLDAGRCLQPAPKEISSVEDRFWPMKFAPLPSHVFRCLSLADPELIFYGDLSKPPSVPAMIVGIEPTVEIEEVWKNWLSGNGLMPPLDSDSDKKEIPVSSAGETLGITVVQGITKKVSASDEEKVLKTDSAPLKTDDALLRVLTPSSSCGRQDSMRAPHQTERPSSDALPSSAARESTSIVSGANLVPSAPQPCEIKSAEETQPVSVSRTLAECSTDQSDEKPAAEPKTSDEQEKEMAPPAADEFDEEAIDEGALLGLSASETDNDDCDVCADSSEGFSDDDADEDSEESAESSSVMNIASEGAMRPPALPSSADSFAEGTSGRPMNEVGSIAQDVPDAGAGFEKVLKTDNGHKRTESTVREAFAAIKHAKELKKSAEENALLLMPEKTKKGAAHQSQASDALLALMAEIRQTLESQSGRMWSEPLEIAEHAIFIDSTNLFREAASLGLRKSDVVTAVNSTYQAGPKKLVFKTVRRQGKPLRLIGLVG